MRLAKAALMMASVALGSTGHSSVVFALDDSIQCEIFERQDGELPPELNRILFTGKAVGIERCRAAHARSEFVYTIYGRPALKNKVCTLGFWQGSSNYPEFVPAEIPTEPRSRLLAMARSNACPDPLTTQYSLVTGVVAETYAELNGLMQSAVSAGDSFCEQHRIVRCGSRTIGEKRRLAFLLTQASKEGFSIFHARRDLDLGVAAWYSFDILIAKKATDGLAVTAIRLPGGRYVITSITPGGS